MNPLNHFINMDAYSYNRLRAVEIVRLANIIARKLAPYASRVTIAGSIRRGLNPSDVDIVLIPKDKAKIRQVIIGMGGKIWSEGSTQIYFKLQGIDVNIYYTEPESYGAQLLTRTGPRGGNIGNRTLAKSRGMLLNQYGLFKGKRKIAGRTEKEIYESLGKKYKPPELRGL